MGYKTFAQRGKAPIKREDIGPGQIYLEHLSPALFLELQRIKLHLHTDVDSRSLPRESTPFLLRGYKLMERIERNTHTWTGTASASGSIVITFGSVFTEVPTVLANPSGGDINIQTVIGSKSATGFTVYWKDDTSATHTSVPIDWLAIGR